jgi:hypothetical protein
MCKNFFYSLFIITLAEYVIPDCYQKRTSFQSFKPFNRFAQFKTSDT